MSRVLLASVLAGLASCSATGTDSHGSHESTAKTLAVDPSAYAKDGFHVDIVDGRIWVFREGTEALAEYLRVGEPAKSVTLVGAGPDGMTIRGYDRDEIQSYLMAKPGYFVDVVEGRLWVFDEGSEDLAEYLRVGEPAKSVTLVGAGPNGMTMRGSDKETLLRYMDA